MTVSKTRSKQSALSPWRVLLVFAVLLYLLLSLLYLFLGIPNADEGWYLYASRLVYEGQLPYRDFAYSQMPLLPYLYGLPQLLLGPGMYLGRATSVFFSFLALAVCLLAARSRGGQVAAALTALFLLSFTFGVYFDSIVKTYALTALLFALTLLVLSSDLREERRYPLAVLTALSAMLVRLSAAAFAVVIFVYCLRATKRKTTRLGVALVCLIMLTVAACFVLPDPHAARWNLLGLHLYQWQQVGNISLAGQLQSIARERLPDLLKLFAPYLLLLLVLGIIAYFKRDMRASLRRNSHLVAVAVGLALFALSHLLNGTWHLEYFVPAIVVLTPLLAVWSCQAFEQYPARSPARVLLSLTLVGVMLWGPLSQGRKHLDFSGGQPPLEKIHEVAGFVAEHTQPTDQLLVFEALWVAIDGHRAALPGLSMAQFSYRDLPAEEARRLKVVNYDMVVSYIRSRAAAAIVLTEGDWLMLGTKEAYSRELTRRDLSDQILKAIAENYRLGARASNFGQGPGKVYVYLRR